MNKAQMPGSARAHKRVSGPHNMLHIDPSLDSATDLGRILPEVLIVVLVPDAKTMMPMSTQHRTLHEQYMNNLQKAFSIAFLMV